MFYKVKDIFLEALSGVVEVHLYVKTKLFQDEFFEIVITVLDGNNVFLEIDFGDGLSPIAEAVINSPLCMNYSFLYM